MNRKPMSTKTIILISVLGAVLCFFIIVTGFVLAYITTKDREDIIKNGQNFTAECIEVKKRVHSSNSSPKRHPGTKRTYSYEAKFKVTSPEECEGMTFYQYAGKANKGDKPKFSKGEKVSGKCAKKLSIGKLRSYKFIVIKD